MRRLLTLALVCGLFALRSTVVSSAPAASAVPAQQAQCFSETGFCIDEPAFQQYFANRGGARILGFPVSRVFRLEGFPVQFYQRVVLQLQGGNVARLNLLDPGVLPVTRANQSIFPGPDPELAADAPRSDDPAYATRVVDYLRAVAPDSWNGLPVGFSALFNSTVPAGDVTSEILTLLNLEIWGLPTSQPQFDPGNPGFVYQRFQRGIMHFRTECGCTEGILVGDYLKGVLTGNGLPPDLASEMQSSRYFLQYNSGGPGWVARPATLPDTDMTAAFEPGSDVPTVATPTPMPFPATTTPLPPTPTPQVAATATPIPLAALSGNVNPPQAGVRVALLDLPIETTTGGNGGYRLSDLPLGEHFVYAVAPDGQVSDTYRVNLSGDLTLNVDLQKFKPGSPLRFVGRVRSASDAPVEGATVWRLGGAGRTISGGAGNFVLVDTPANMADAKPPDHLTLVAVSGNRWGILRVNTTQDSEVFAVKLEREGTPPTPPRRVFDFVANAANANNRLFNPNEADFFTARWTTPNGDDLITVELVDSSGNPISEEKFSIRSTDCAGNCDDVVSSAISVKLPRDQAFRIRPKVNQAPGDATKPGWAEAQAVSYR